MYCSPRLTIYGWTLRGPASRLPGSRLSFSSASLALLGGGGATGRGGAALLSGTGLAGGDSVRSAAGRRIVSTGSALVGVLRAPGADLRVTEAATGERGWTVVFTRSAGLLRIAAFRG